MGQEEAGKLKATGRLLESINSYGEAMFLDGFSIQHKFIDYCNICLVRFGPLDKGSFILVPW